MIAIFPRMLKIELIDAYPGEESINVLSQVWKFLVHYHLDSDHPLEHGKWRIFHSRQYTFYYPTIYDSGICALLNCVGIFYCQSLRNYDEEVLKKAKTHMLLYFIHEKERENSFVPFCLE